MLLLTEKYLCWSVNLILSITKFLRAPILKNICQPLLLKMCLWKWEKLKFIHKEFWLYIKIQVFSTSIYQKKFMIGILWLVSHEVCIHILYFFDVVRNKLQLLNMLIKRRSKVQEKNMSCERASDFDKWKTFSENYKPMRAWFWLVYKFAENYGRSWLFSELIQTQKRYPTSLSWQNAYPNLKTTCHIKLKFFLWTKLLRNLLLPKYLISVDASLSI